MNVLLLLTIEQFLGFEFLFVGWHTQILTQLFSPAYLYYYIILCYVSGKWRKDLATVRYISDVQNADLVLNLIDTEKRNVISVVMR